MNAAVPCCQHGPFTGHGNKHVHRSHLLHLLRIRYHFFPCLKLCAEDLTQLMVVRFYQKRMIRQYIDQQISRGIHCDHHTPAFQPLHDPSVHIVRHGTGNASGKDQHVTGSQNVEFLQQLLHMPLTDLRPAAVDLRPVDRLQLHIDPRYAVVYPDQIRPYPHLLYPADDLLSRKSRHEPKRRILDAQIAKHHGNI